MLNKNIQALKKHLIPEFIDKILNSKIPDWCDEINSKDNSKNILVKIKSKKVSMYDLNGYNAQEDKRLDDLTNFKKSQALMVIGSGLGYFIKSFLEKADEKHILVIVEPEPWILKQTLFNVDLSKHIDDGRIFITPTIEDLSYFLEVINEKNIIDDWAYLIEPYTISNPSYEQLSYEAVSILNQIRCNIGTVSHAGTQIADNDIANLPYVIHRRGVNELKDLYKGLPAVLVSTGPSLKKNIHILKEMQDNVIIIAVGQALRPLLAYDIKPDFICSVDYGDVNLTHYEGLMESDVPLVALNRSFAPLLKRWQGPMFVACSPQVDMHPDHANRVHKILSDKGWTVQGGSVAHMCYGLGILLGCSPLIMIGQDLAYDSKQSHFEQADSRGVLKRGEQGDLKWEIKDPRCNIKGHDHSMGIPIPVAGYFGGEVLTNVGLASFLTSFERFIKDIKEPQVINATEGGAHIQGTKRMSLKRALEIYCNNSLKNKTDVLESLLSNADNAMDLVKQAIPLLKKEINLLNQCKTNARKGLDANKEIRKLSSRIIIEPRQEHKYRKLLSDNQKYSEQAHYTAALLPLVMLALYGASRKINHSSMKVKGDAEHLLQNEDDMKTRIERNKIILESCIETCNKLKKSYNETLDRLVKASNANDLSFLVPKQKEPEPDISDAEEYFSVGNFARPMLEAKRMYWDRMEHNVQKTLIKAYNLRDKAIKQAKQLPDNSDLIDSIQLVHDAQEIGRKDKAFEKARDMLQEALDKEPNNEIAKWGLATACFHTKNFEKSIELYNQLIEINPNKKRYLFELGQVLIHDGSNKNDKRLILKGVDKMLDAMDGTSEFDSSLPIVGDLLCDLKMPSDAAHSYKEYLDKFPADYEILWRLVESGNSAFESTLDNEFKQWAIESQEKAIQLKGE